MTPEELELVIQPAMDHEIHNEGELDAITTARADLAAMRQPITAEALNAAGAWTHESTGLYRHDMVKAGDLGSVRLFVDFCVDGPPAVYIGDLILPDVRAMYDLRELVRLLGGAK